MIDPKVFGLMAEFDNVNDAITAARRTYSAGYRKLDAYSPFPVEELSEAIENTKFNTPFSPVYQNVVAKAVTHPAEIKSNLIAQLTGPVKWTQTVERMIADGATEFTECGPGKVLQGLVAKINKEVTTNGLG